MDAEPDWSRGVALGILGLLVVAFVASGWTRFVAPFGDNHDGSNAGVWVDLGRAVTDQGPFASHLGSRLLTGGVYAHHPPLIAWLTAAFDWVGGQNSFADRLPVIVGSLACIGLLVLLLRDLRLSWIAIAGGLGVALGTPLFFVYGPMLDTLPLSLPIGVGLLVVWQRRVVDGRAAGWLLGVAAAAAVLSSWEGALLAGVICFASLVLGRRDTPRLRHLAPVFVGTAVGAIIVGAWLLWASGSFGPMWEQLQTRSGTGSAPVTLHDSLQLQWENLGSVMGFVRWLLLPAAIAGLWNRRTRLVMCVLVPTAAIYPVLLREAAVHDFWNIWFVAPLAIGLAAAIDAAARVTRPSLVRPVVTVAVCAVVALSLFETVVRDPIPTQLFDFGVGAAHALDGHHSTDDNIYVVLPRGYNTNWLALRTGAHVKPISTGAELTAAQARHPNALILLDCQALSGDLVTRCLRRSPDGRGPLNGAYAAMTIREFLALASAPAG